MNPYSAGFRLMVTLPLSALGFEFNDICLPTVHGRHFSCTGMPDDKWFLAKVLFKVTRTTYNNMNHI